MTFERGVYRGRGSHGDITGGEERSTLVLGPTRSGKTSWFIIPNLLLTTSPSVTTSTKTDVVNLTARARHDGATLLFDPPGTVSTPRGVLRVGYSPIRQAPTWDGSVLATRTLIDVARRGRPERSDDHWTERGSREMPCPDCKMSRHLPNLRVAGVWRPEIDLERGALLVKGGVASLWCPLTTCELRIEW